MSEFVTLKGNSFSKLFVLKLVRFLMIDDGVMNTNTIERNVNNFMFCLEFNFYIV